MEGATNIRTVTVSIGRNVGDRAMPEQRWEHFREDVDGYVDVYATDVHVRDAAGIGRWVSDAGDVIVEDSRTWVADVRADEVAAMSSRLAFVAWEYGQEAIALTVGETTLVRPMD